MTTESATASATPYGTLAPASTLPTTFSRKQISLPRLREMHANGEKITMLTAYDATFAAVVDAAGVECILVGDSLGMVCQGLSSTVGVSLETMRHHTECVANGLRRAHGVAWLIGDLPFGSYHESKEQALRSATVLMQAGAHMVKLEGGGWTADVRWIGRDGHGVEIGYGAQYAAPNSWQVRTSTGPGPDAWPETRSQDATLTDIIRGDI